MLGLNIVSQDLIFESIRLQFEFNVHEQIAYICGYYNFCLNCLQNYLYYGNM